MARRIITQDFLKSVLEYDPTRGRLRWLQRSSNRCSVGWFKGSPTASGHRLISIQGTRYYVHRVAFMMMTGRWPREIDHINHKQGDNRWDNLRECSRSQNNRNRKQTTGAWFHRQRGGWCASIKVNGEKFYLGKFRTKVEAVAAYKEAATRYFNS